MKKKKKVLRLTAPEGSICFYWNGIQTKWSTHFTSFSHKHMFVLLLLWYCLIIRSCLIGLNHISVYIIYEKVPPQGYNKPCIINRTCTSTNHLLLYTLWIHPQILFDFSFKSAPGLNWGNQPNLNSFIQINLEIRCWGNSQSGGGCLVGGVNFSCGLHAWSISDFQASFKHPENQALTMKNHLLIQDKSVYQTFHQFKLNSNDY